jgi:hypothetical protein
MSRSARGGSRGWRVAFPRFPGCGAVAAALILMGVMFLLGHGCLVKGRIRIGHLAAGNLFVHQIAQQAGNEADGWYRS